MKFSIFIALAALVCSAASSGIYEKRQMQNKYEAKQPYEQNQYGYPIISTYNSDENEIASKAGLDQAQSAYASAVKTALSHLTSGAKANEYGPSPVYNQQEYGIGQEAIRKVAIAQAGKGGKYGPSPVYSQQEYGMGQETIRKAAMAQAAQAKVLYNKGMGAAKPAKAIYNKEKYPKPEPYVNRVYQQGQQEYAGKQVINIPAYQEGEAYGAEYGVPIDYKIPEYNYEPEPVGKVVILPELYEKVAPKRDFEKDININPRPIRPVFKEYETYPEPPRYGENVPKYNQMKQVKYGKPTPKYDD